MTITEREPYVDFLRAVSLLVVVVWHWAFTILYWTPAGPQPTNPLGFFSGLWIFTWLLQVLPVFFYVGGYVHLASWHQARARGDRMRHYVWRHVKQLLLPACGLILTWAVLGLVLATVFDPRWIRSTVLLIISPLWFLAVYLGLLVLLPVMSWLHERFDVLVLVWLGGIAMLVDVLRLRYGYEWVGWINMAAVWGLAYQAGFFYRRIVDAPRRVDLALLWAGLFALMGLVFSGLYPGSMVGVPGQRLSNMAPPTFVIVALLTFQIGVAEVLRPAVERRLTRPRWQRATGVLTRFALPLFLFHTTGMALARAVVYFAYDRHISDDRAPDWIWWAERPLAVLGPLLFTIPVIAIFGRRWTRRTGAPK
ncbi:acyltransferase family protein [Amycolatopsis pithecellobii]|uniref:Acyltransferase family protein n=1 Tax=Amycolatopsis pithecellobii TaxID=664692 RepID=A0A6N7Z1E4_9PSEU|nr:acyltransferase [Amycolatopsis pithecellobii]MTD54609.1 acyltransferase family protein [Amycolatopsis pithecellobii]